MDEGSPIQEAGVIGEITVTEYNTLSLRHKEEEIGWLSFYRPMSN